jgi:hypothetical protein
MAKKPANKPVNLKTKNLFQTLEAEAFRNGITPRSQESITWFRQRAHDIRRLNRSNIMKDDRVDLRNRQAVGRMYFWFYDPKHKKTLPYYDSFPLGIIVGPAPGGFHALNLHYLPPLIRAKFLDELMGITNNSKYDDSTKFELSYGLLKGATKYKEFKPCFKHYLTKHVRSRFALVPSSDWEIATFLPTASWEKKSAREVYKFSRELIK